MRGTGIMIRRLRPLGTFGIGSQSKSNMYYKLMGECGCMRTKRTIATSTSTGAGSTFMTDSSLPTGGSSSPITVNILEYIDTIQQSGKAAVLFSDSPPVLLAVDFLCLVKDLPGMSWISTILFGTVVVRAAVALPVAVIQQKAIGRLEKLKPEFQNLADELKKELAYAIKKFGWNEKTARIQYTKSYKKHWRKIVEERNCHPMRSLALSLIQLPFWICLSSALRNIVYALPHPRTEERIDRWIQIHDEHTPWVNSLVLPDPVVLPLIFLGTNMLNIELARRQRLQQAIPQTKLQMAVPWIMRGVIVTIAIISTTVPSAVSMYWAASSSIALGQNIFLRSEAAKQLFNLPTFSPPTNVTADDTTKSKSSSIGSNEKPPAL